MKSQENLKYQIKGKTRLEKLHNADLLKLVFTLWQAWFSSSKVFEEPLNPLDRGLPFPVSLTCQGRRNRRVDGVPQKIVAFVELPPKSRLADKKESFFTNNVGVHYEQMGRNIDYFSSISLEDLSVLQEKLKNNSNYPQDSSFNLFFGASTVPITPFVEVLYSLLLRTPIICRIPENYSLEFYKYFEERIPDELQDCISFVHWSSKDADRTRNFVEAADCVIVHGSDETIEEFRKIVKDCKKQDKLICMKALSSNSSPKTGEEGKNIDTRVGVLQQTTFTKSHTKQKTNKKLLGFGHKASFAVIQPSKNRDKANSNSPFSNMEKGGSEAEGMRSPNKEKLTKKLTEDIHAFNQLGCMSPQCVFLLSFEKEERKLFAQELANSLSQKQFYLEPSAAFKKQAFIEEICANRNVEIIEDLVILEQDEPNQQKNKANKSPLLKKQELGLGVQPFDYTIGYGVVWIKTLDSLEELCESVKVLEGKVACIGHNLEAQDESKLKNLFPKARTCDVGEMQTPSLFWLQDSY